jgi:periplasmic protein TonB
MTTGFPVAAVADALARPPRALRSRSVEPAGTSAVRYAGRRNSRALLVGAIVASIGLHAGLLLGLGPPRKKAAAGPLKEQTISVRLALPDVKELEEPDPAPVDSDAPPPDPGILVPMQADVPQLAKPSDFVQPLNFASLLEQPDFSKLNVYAVPENIRTSGAKLAERLGKIFNLDDLDRVPEAVLQPAPVFPVAMRREAESATVSVEFIVDTTGRVLDPVVFESTHTGFNDAALAGVSRWKFRAGIRAGKKVNTRMRVPIVFKILDPID